MKILACDECPQTPACVLSGWVLAVELLNTVGDHIFAGPCLEEQTIQHLLGCVH